ncbi:hypothetical protein [Gilvibacter sp.]|jgi:hypothetical protein|uniref:hypothetical protein n=1 Tax=Gilvibacter sp. TaxID=2729997 RepID=UPI003B5176D3
MTIVDFWKNINYYEKPFIHPEDISIIKSQSYSYKGLHDLLNDQFWTDEGVFHTDLFPIPYAGKLDTAKIFILLLNPGFTLSEYNSEESSSEFRKALRDNLAQKHLDPDFPFMFLNPELLWHSGGQYWLSKLKDLILFIKNSRQISYLEAISSVSKSVAILELIPYHSTKFTRVGSLSKIASAQKMKSYVHSILIDRLNRNEICIICTRKSKFWELPEHENAIVYQGTECRSASLSMNSRAFSTMARFVQ